MKVTHTFRRLESNNERGVTMVLVAAAMVAIIGMAAMSIDLVTLYLAREEAQRAADAAALAAARIISVSGITGTANPTGDPTDWSSICGPENPGRATQTAMAVAAQNSVGGQSVTVNVTYSDGGAPTNDCSTLSAKFAVNPMVTVQVVPTTIPSFFSRIWGRAGNKISASATAEAFNPSASNTNGITTSGNVTPVQPRCVKPWIVPNVDPGNGGCSIGSCQQFVSTANGTIQNPQIAPAGVIGESFYLFADCKAGTTTSCAVQDFTPKANLAPGGFYGGAPKGTPNLEYLPGAVPSTFQAVPSCAPASDYASAVAGCDAATVYQCGQTLSALGNPNTLDLSENPAGSGGDTAQGLACSLTGNGNSGNIPLVGQDTLRTSSYPFVAIAGSANPIGLGSGTTSVPITASNSIVSLPIYDGATLPANSNTPPVAIVGFLQVFVNEVSSDGSVYVTVLNVAGCGSNANVNPPVFGSSPVPVRLITPPPPPQ